MASKTQDKALAELKKSVKLMRKLWRANLQSYLDLLKNTDPAEIKASMRAAIDGFLRDNGVILTNMVALDQVEALQYLDGAVRGELMEPQGVVEYEDPMLAEMEPVGPDELWGGHDDE